MSTGGKGCGVVGGRERKDRAFLFPRLETSTCSLTPYPPLIFHSEEIAASAPLIGPIQPLSSLEAEYAAAGPAASVFVAKIKGLAPSFAALRRARGDGNCFYRAVLFAHAEGCVARGDTAERNRFVTRLRQAAAKLSAAGYEPLV